MIRVVVQDEDGNEISEAIDVPGRLLARPNETRFSCLCFVDPYGDTVFNRLQMQSLRNDLSLLGDVEQDIETVRRIEALIEQCEATPHLYLRLIGD
jgi:hypothetical protein